MKTNKSIRSIVAMMVIFFAATTTSCKKEETLSPTPVSPTLPVTPIGVAKPTFILTTENGSAVRKQSFEYNAQGKLIKYESTGTLNDSVLVRESSIIFKNIGSNNAGQVLSFNADKTFKSLFSATDQTDFVNNQTKLSRMTKLRADNTSFTVGEFAYNGNNLSVISAEIRIDINYHDNLPYQKGINEIPVFLKPIRYHKLMELENATSTVLYSKLIRQVILDFGNRRELHDYTYTFDSNQRVTQIRDTQTFVTSTSSTQKILISTITY